MVYIYATRPSTAAKDLVVAVTALGVQCKRLRAGMRRRWALADRRGNLIVGWGEGLGGVRNARTINAQRPGDKLAEMRAMIAAGVSTPALSMVPREGYIARTRNHQQGLDLRAGRQRGDYYMEKLNIVREFRIHIWGDVSIRAGMKVRRPGFPNPHPWIRSYDAGWNIDYNGAAQDHMRQAYRDEAKKAVAALGLTFGAVDLGITNTRRVVVFEVNTAPSLDNHNTAAAYARKIVEASRVR